HSTGAVRADQSLEVIDLRGADGGVAVIVGDKEFDGQAKTLDSGQLLDVHLETSVAINADRPASGRNGGANRRWQCKTHRAGAAGVEAALVRLDFQAEQENLDGEAGTAWRNDV